MYRQALADGMEHPIVVVADTRNGKGQELANHLGNQQELAVLQEYRDTGMIPVAVVAFPYGEETLRVFGSMMTPNGKQGLERAASKPGYIPVVVISGHGNLYAGVPESE